MVPGQDTGQEDMMEFSKIVRRSFDIAWSYKTLWLFGLFAGWGGSFNLNLPGGGIDGSEFFNRFEDVGAFGNVHDFEFLGPAIGAAILAVFVLWVLWLIMHCISVPAIIDANNKIERGGIYQMGTSFSRGVDFFWRFLGLFILGFVAVFSTIVVCVILVITIVGIIIAIPLALFSIYFWITLFELAKRVIVIRDCSIGDALAESWALIKRSFGDTVLMFLILIGLSIAFGIAGLLVWAMFGIPVGAVVYAVTENGVAAMILGLLIGLPVSIVFGGYFGTFFTSLYTLFYIELVEPTPKIRSHPADPAPPSTSLPRIDTPPFTPAGSGPDTSPPPPVGPATTGPEPLPGDDQIPDKPPEDDHSEPDRPDDNPRPQ